MRPAGYCQRLMAPLVTRPYLEVPVEVVELFLMNQMLAHLQVLLAPEEDRAR